MSESSPIHQKKPATVTLTREDADWIIERLDYDFHGVAEPDRAVKLLEYGSESSQSSKKKDSK
jgi:hypothetical protein